MNGRGTQRSRDSFSHNDPLAANRCRRRKTPALLWFQGCILLVACALGGQCAPGAAWAAGANALDWSAWQHMPVLHQGRVKPLDTFARLAVESICGRQSPRLVAPGAPGAKPRRFASAELLFSWLVEPEQWEELPFLKAEHERLRKELLGVALVDASGNRLKYVSPQQVARSSRFRQRCRELDEKRRQADARGEDFAPAGMDAKVEELSEAYRLYRMLTFNPAAPGSLSSRFLWRWSEMADAWTELERLLSPLEQAASQGGLRQALTTARQSHQTLSGLIGAREWSRETEDEVALEKIEPPLAAMRDAAGALAERFNAHADRLLEQAPPNTTPQQRDRMRLNSRTLAVRAAEVARLANEALWALYDSGGSLQIAPALNAAALDKKRDPRDHAQPWLSLQTLILGSDVLLAQYPRDELREVREAFHEAGTIYVGRDAPDRPARFARALERFAAAVRALGEAVEPARQQLPISNWDEELMAATAYPPPGFGDAEVRYNRLDPFFWSWSISLASLVGFGLSFGVMRKPMFWLGVLLLLAAQTATLGGFGFRWHITGLVPVTNMFETVVFTALVVSLLGIWFALVPLLWPGLTGAWRLTALPAMPSADARGSTAQWLLLLPRVALAVAVFWALGWMPYGETGEPIFRLLPRAGASAGAIVNNLLTWSVGLSVLGLSVWYVPRAALTAAAAVVTIPLAWRREGLRRPIEQVMERRVFALVGAAVALLAGILAYYAPAPVFIREIRAVRPILRDNFWLLVHVLTITASYGAGALAWGLGNIALGHYLFGRYRDPPTPSPETLAQGHRPAGRYEAPPEAFARRAPAACAPLAAYIYKATQVAVLLLVAGTITGALWADVAWGRFWGWDSKEVAALISTMVYLAILHGRYAGWFGNFGLAVGSVLGATAIIAAWYGVNYLFGSQLHGYGSGAGGQLEVSLIIAANWLFMIAAGVRYGWETRTAVQLRASNRTPQPSPTMPATHRTHQQRPH